MNGKPTNNIDDIFKSSLEPVETEPSEGFWIRASEDSLFKNNLAKRSELNKWKTTAYILGVAIITLAIYLIYSQEELSGIKKQLSKFKEENALVQSAPQQPIQASAPLAVNVNKQNSLPTTQITEQTLKKATDTRVVLSNTVIANTEKKNSVPKQFVSNTSAHSISPVISSEVSATTSDIFSNATNKQLPEQTQSVDNVQGTVNNTNSEVKNNATTKNEISTDVVNVTPETQTPTALKTIKADSASVNAVVSNVEPAGKKSIWSKFSASIFYAPLISDEFFENESTDNTTINNVTANEEEVNPFMLGARIGYDLSSRLSVTIGLYYYSFQVAISPITIYAQKQQSGDVGYAFQTSLGNVNCQESGTPCVGDGMKINGTATVHYLSIPLQVKYNILSGSRFGLYMTAGGAINIVAYRKMDLHWQELKSGQGDELQAIQNSESVYYSFYAAPGISYKLLKGFSLYLEPSVIGSPSFLGQSGSYNHAPLFVGLGGGITCHF